MGFNPMSDWKHGVMEKWRNIGVCMEEHKSAYDLRDINVSMTFGTEKSP
jgi:hypothetical protein